MCYTDDTGSWKADQTSFSNWTHHPVFNFSTIAIFLASHLKTNQLREQESLMFPQPGLLSLTLGPVKEVLIMRYSAHLASRDLL